MLSARRSFAYVNRDGGIWTRDPLNPIRLQGRPKYYLKSRSMGRTGVGVPFSVTRSSTW